MVGRYDPVERHARFRFDHARQKCRDLRAAHAVFGKKAAARIRAGEESPAVHQKDLAAIGRFLCHVGDKIAAGIAGGHDLGIDVLIPFLGQGKGKDAGHLRAGGGQKIETLETVVQQVFTLEIGDIGRVPRFLRIRPGCQQRVAAGLVNTPQPRRDGQQLCDGDVILRCKAPAAPPAQQPVLVGGSNGGGIPAALVYIGKITLIAVHSRKARRFSVVRFRLIRGCCIRRILCGGAALRQRADGHQQHERKKKRHSA